MIEEAIRSIIKEELTIALRSAMAAYSDEILTIDEVCKIYKLTKRTVQKYNSEGLKYIKTRPLRYRRSDIELFFNEKTICNQ